jgi:hypothetical protein
MVRGSAGVSVWLAACCGVPMRMLPVAALPIQWASAMAIVATTTKLPLPTMLMVFHLRLILISVSIGAYEPEVS